MSLKYSLQRGTGENVANWYLSNQRDGSVEPEKPGEPETPVVPDKPTPPTKPGSSGGETQRPESASYTANLAAANTMFLTRLHGRLGETQYIDALTGEQKVTSMWMRNVGGTPVRMTPVAS